MAYILNPAHDGDEDRVAVVFRVDGFHGLGLASAANAAITAAALDAANELIFGHDAPRPAAEIVSMRAGTDPVIDARIGAAIVGLADKIDPMLTLLAAVRGDAESRAREHDSDHPLWHALGALSRAVSKMLEAPENASVFGPPTESRAPIFRALNVAFERVAGAMRRDPVTREWSVGEG